MMKGTGMNEIQVFNNNQFGEIRTMTKDGEPWFVAADVCRALEITNVGNALARLDDDEKSSIRSTDVTSNGGNPNVSIVNEPGLYTLVLGSRKPEAKTFKRWITHEVIPSIRKTGSYTMKPSADDEVKQLRARAMNMNAETRRFKATVSAMKEFGLSQVAMEAIGVPLIEEFTGIKSGYRPQIEKTYSASEIAEELGVSANLIGKTANEHGVKADEYGIYVLDKSRHSSKQVQTFRYNERGRARIKELLAPKLGA